MESTRFKRREKQTQRQTLEGFTGESAPQVVLVRRVKAPEITVQKPKKLPQQTKVLKSTPEPIVAEAPVEQRKTVEARPRPVHIDMSLPGNDSYFYSGKVVVRRSKWLTIRRWSFRTAAVIMILGIGLGGLLFSQGYLKLHKVFKGGAKTAAALTANVNPDLLKGEGDGRINVLLLGRGGGDHDGPDLTDTMMLASIDPVNHTEALLSIPRDLWVDIPNQGAMKINAAWETGEFSYEGKIAPGSTDSQAIQAGFDEADQTVENVLGVTIDYNAIMDFQAFQQAVTTIGGVSINVPTELYDPTMAWQNHNNPILAEPGLQTFTGSQALNYVRSRETTSDFSRAQRQRSVLLAIKGKAETLGTISNPLKLSGLMSDFGNNVATDISLSDAGKLYGIIKDITDTNTSSIGLADSPNNYVTTSNLNGQSIDIPSAGMFNYGAIQNFVRGQLKDPYIVKENAKIMVLNGTFQSGLATTKEAELKSYGYNVIGAADAPSSAYEQTIVVDLSKGKDPYTKHYLEQRFNTTAVTKLPDSTIQTNGADFVIIVGNDETTTSQS